MRFIGSGTVGQWDSGLTGLTGYCLLNVIKLTVISPQFSVGSLESQTGNC